MKRLLAFVALIFPLIGFAPAYSQVGTAVAVSSCGTPPLTYTAGQFYPLTQDTTGKFCGASSVTGTAGINQTQLNSVALGSPSLWGVSPGAVNVQAVNAAIPPVPATSTPETASSGNVANASAVATLAASVGKTTYITGFQCTASGATSALVVNLTVAGIITGTQTLTFTFPAGVTTAATPVSFTYPTPMPASTTNTTIVVTLPAGGAGNTNAACSATGFQF